ncbi:MAG: N-acetylmuramoyl-L-alanine amidase [bacterium]|nr:N-acetylmuramoyl-L-alanine amidase [bacterium]
MLHVRKLAIILAAWLMLSQAVIAGLPRSPSPTPAGHVLPQTVNIGGRSKEDPKASEQALPKLSGEGQRISVTAKGKKYDLRIQPAGGEEYYVAADDKALSALAKAFDASLEWHDRHGLKVKRGGKKLTLGIGDLKLPDEVGGRELDVPSQIVDGTPWVPLSGVGDLLGVCFTIDKNGKSAWAESYISNVYFERHGDIQQLVVQSEHELSYKTFSLKNPARYVVDISGGVLNVENTNISHPHLGAVRLGQFSLSPAITRVVIPLAAGYYVSPKQDSRGSKLIFAINGGSSGGVKDNSSTAVRPVSAVSYREQRLTSANVENKHGTSYVHLKFSGPVQYEWSRLISPDYRFFVDLPNVILAGGKQELKVDNRQVDGVRISQNSRNPAKTRVVLDMKSPLAVQVEPGTDSSSLKIAISSKTVPANSSIISGAGSTGGSANYSAPGGRGETSVGYRPGSGRIGKGTLTICIDPGHGGNDTGAYNRSIGLAEEDVTLDVSLRMRDLLRSSGWNVVLTREDDRDVSYAGSTDSEELWARANVANECGADVFVSIHCNSAANTAADGTSIHAYKQSDIVLGNELIGPLIRTIGRRNRGVQQDRFYVLAHTNMPAVLVETAFLSNYEEGHLLNDPAFRQSIAEGLAEGLNNYAAKYLQEKSTLTPAVLSTPEHKRIYITTRPARHRANSRSSSSREAEAVKPQSVLK